MEVWKEILGFDILYEVSNLGRVRTRYFKERGYTFEYRFLKPVDNGNGYLRFNWKLNGKQKTVYLHKLVATAFVENPNGYKEVNHLDENKKNNYADNLQWVSHVENCNHGTRNKRVAEKTSKSILCVETGIKYKSVSEAAHYMGIVKTAISNCLNGRSNTAAGYHWGYVDV